MIETKTNRPYSKLSENHHAQQNLSSAIASVVLTVVVGVDTADHAAAALAVAVETLLDKNGYLHEKTECLSVVVSIGALQAANEEPTILHVDHSNLYQLDAAVVAIVHRAVYVSCDHGSLQQELYLYSNAAEDERIEAEKEASLAQHFHVAFPPGNLFFWKLLVDYGSAESSAPASAAVLQPDPGC